MANEKHAAILPRIDADLARLAAIVESSDDAIVSKNLDGIITSWNSGAERLFGYTAAEAIGKPVLMLIPDDRHDEEREILRRIRAGEKVDHYETVRVRKDGTPVSISLTVSPLMGAAGKVVGASKIARDITERRQAETATRESEIMLRLIEAQESERRRIARDLHDHVGQEVTALRLKLEVLLKDCEHDPEISRRVSEIRDISERIDQDVGFLSWELRPVELDDFGLEEALRSFVRRWADQYGIDAEFKLHLDQSSGADDRLSRTVETNIYRILQEALNNIVKHADARSVEVEFHRRSDQAMLVIDDDGCGFRANGRHEQGTRISGQGLTGMRERAVMLKGSLDVESEVGKGTRIRVRIPL